MDEQQFHEWFAERRKVKSDDPLWPYLKWRYEKENSLRITANEWAFHDSLVAWAEMQLAQRSRPWARREETPEYRKQVLAKMRAKGLLPQEPNDTSAAA